MIKKSKTCIAITKNSKGKLMMAGDRCVSFGEEYVASIEPTGAAKVQKKGGLLLGASGSGDLCSFFVDVGGFKVPKLYSGNIAAYMFNKFKPRVIKSLVTYGNLAHDIKCDLLVGVKGQAWLISIEGNTISLDRLPETTIAIGCGGLVASAIMKYVLTKKMYLTKEDMRDIFKTVGTIIPGCDTNCDIIEEGG